MLIRITEWAKGPADYFSSHRSVWQILIFPEKDKSRGSRLLANLHPVGQMLLSNIHTVQLNTGELQWITQKDEPCEGLTVLQLCWELIDLILTAVRLGRHASTSSTVQF